MILPHICANSAQLVEMLRLGIRYLLVAIVPHRELWWIGLP